jgi:hypothetical protein
MNCQQFQEEILNGFAAGDSETPAKSLAHRLQCSECRRYYEAQLVLFGSIEQGLGRIVNVPVPPSLLPVVRARLEQRTAPRFSRHYGWTLATVACTALAAVAFAFFWHRPQPISPGPEITQGATVGQSIVERHPALAVPEVANTVRKAPAQLVKHHEQPATPESAEQPTSEVIVLAEEREAFSRFLAQVPENPAMAAALTRPAPKENESAVEIALLKIDTLEVKPLESTE